MITGKNIGQSGKKAASFEAASISQVGITETVANGAVLVSDLDVKDGLYVVSDDTNGKSAIIAVHNASVSTIVAGDASISAAKDTLSKLNFYVETGSIKVQNNLAAGADVTIKSYV